MFILHKKNQKKLRKVKKSHTFATAFGTDGGIAQLVRAHDS